MAYNIAPKILLKVRLKKALMTVNKLLFFQKVFIFANTKLIIIISIPSTRVGLHTPKMLIIQFHTSSHTIFIQFLKLVDKLISVAV